MFVVMRLASMVVLSHLDAGFRLRCGLKDFLSACCCCLLRLLLLLAKTCCSTLPLKGGVKPRQGKPSSVIQTRSRTELGPSLAQRIRSGCMLWCVGVVVSP